MDKFLDGLVKLIHIAWYAIVGVAAILTIIHHAIDIAHL